VTGPIQVEVAADGRGVLVAGDDRWTFDLDLDSGTAVLATRATGSLPVRVRALRWREKLTLARFAGLSDVFMARAVATACASARAPGDPDDATVAALAAWLEGPAAAAAIGGSDAERLAAMTVDLCRLTGLRPSDLDDLPAGEVVQLWMAARDAATDVGVAPEPQADLALDAWSAGATRIVVIDDLATEGAGPPPDAAEREEASEHVPSSPIPGVGAGTEATPAVMRAAVDEVTPESDIRPDHAAGGDRPARPARRVIDRAPAVALRRATSDPPTLVGGSRSLGSEPAPPSAPTPVAHANVDADGLLAPSPVASPGAAEPASAPRSTAWRGSSPEPLDRQGRRDALGQDPVESLPAVAAPTAAGHALPPTGMPVATRPTTTAPTLSPARPAPRAVVPAMADPRLPPPRSFRPDITRAVAPSPATGSSVALPSPGPHAAWANAVPGPDRPDEPRPSALDRTERDALFQALADELELAAAELGVGSEA
jgi:hypothetical protein